MSRVDRVLVCGLEPDRALDKEDEAGMVLDATVPSDDPVDAANASRERCGSICENTDGRLGALCVTGTGRLRRGPRSSDDVLAC